MKYKTIVGIAILLSMFVNFKEMLNNITDSLILASIAMTLFAMSADERDKKK